MKRIEKEVPPSGKLLPPCPWHQHVLLGSLATMQTKSRRPLRLFRELMGEAGSGKLTKVWTAHRQRHSAREEPSGKKIPSSELSYLLHELPGGPWHFVK